MDCKPLATSPFTIWETPTAIPAIPVMIVFFPAQPDRKNQKRRELLAANLRDFFRIEGDPFRLTEDGKGWQARFLISPDE